MSTQNPSPTAGMNIAQRILHVGGRNNAAGYVEFGSTQAVEAMVRQVLRDLPAEQSAEKRLDDYATEINRLRNVIQSACLGGTGLMIERWTQLFPDAPVPTVKVLPLPVPEPLLQALRFYAGSQHFHIDPEQEEGFDTVSGEPQNWLCSEREDDGTMIEDGTIARRALLGLPLRWIDGEDDETPQPIDGEAWGQAAQPATWVVPTDWHRDDFGEPIIYNTHEVDSVAHSLTGDEGEEDALSVLQGLVRYVAGIWPGKTALQVLLELEELGVARAPAAPESEICGNCASALPEGCGGLFLSDGTACKYKAQAGKVEP